MTNRKTTKRALLGSVLALVLCFAMLLGSTYAWFTDTDTAAVDVIQAGTLDVAVSVYNGQGWTESPRNLFDADLWEPGYTTYEILKVTNKGNLDLKWTARIGDYTETKGANGESLLNVIHVWTKEITEIPATITRSEVTTWKDCGTLAQFISATNVQDVTNGLIEAAEGNEAAEEMMIIALVMDTTAGNEYQGLKLEGITFQILATQASVEEDIFGADYDADAYDDMFN